MRESACALWVCVLDRMLTLCRATGGWIIGFDNHWWSEKHNTHHALTNHMQHDSDIHNQVTREQGRDRETESLFVFVL